MVNCPKCNQNIEDGTKFCPCCGKKLFHKQRSKKMTRTLIVVLSIVAVIGIAYGAGCLHLKHQLERELVSVDTNEIKTTLMFHGNQATEIIGDDSFNITGPEFYYYITSPWTIMVKDQHPQYEILDRYCKANVTISRTGITFVDKYGEDPFLGDGEWKFKN